MLVSPGTGERRALTSPAAEPLQADEVDELASALVEEMASRCSRHLQVRIVLATQVVVWHGLTPAGESTPRAAESGQGT